MEGLEKHLTEEPNTREVINKYFHKVTKSGFKRMVDEGKTWQDIMKEYKQPNWCSYPDALAGRMGCWSLTSLMIKNKRSCAYCDCKTKI